MITPLVNSTPLISELLYNHEFNLIFTNCQYESIFMGVTLILIYKTILLDREFI